MASKAELRRRVEDLTTFHQLLGALFAVSEFVHDGWGDGQRVVAKVGREPAWYSAKAMLDRHAGRAARAFEEARIYVLWKPPGTWNETPLNPASQWGTICEERPRFSIHVLDACTNQAIGTLEARIDDPIRGERGPRVESLHPVLRVVWKLAVFVVGGLALAWVAWKLGWS